MATVRQSRRRKRSREAGGPFDPTQVVYSLRGLGAGVGAGAFSLALINAGGWQAAALLGAAGVGGALYATLLEPRRPRLERVTLELPDLPPALAGLRIGHLSDLHLGHPYSYANTRWAVAQIAAEKPDVIAITGDFVSYAHAIVDLPLLLRPLQAPLGMFAVVGNHDYWEGVDEVRAAIAPLGIKTLMNEHRVMRIKGADLAIAGVDDIWDGTPDLAAALAGIPQDAFKLLLCHEPDLADEAAAAGVGLQLSGHTHGGHVSLPALGPFALPFYGVRYPVGRLQVGAMALYVTRGIGGMPLRFGCPPEATVITLQGK